MPIRVLALTWAAACAKSVWPSLRKAVERLATGMGFLGLAVVFTVVVAVEETDINLLFIYDKAERESVTLVELLDLLKKNGLK